MIDTTESRIAFLEGRSTHLRLGGYAGTVHLEVRRSVVWLRTTKPTRIQKTIGPDTAEKRQSAVRAADIILANASGRRVNPRLAERPARRHSSKRPVLTVREIWEEYLRSFFGTVPDGVLGWGRPQLERFYHELSPEARAALPSFDSILIVLQAARRLHKDCIAPLDGDINAVEPADFSAYLVREVVSGSSANTVNTYFGRYRTAVRHYKTQRTKLWGKRTDPTENVKKPSGRAALEIGESEARRLINHFWGAGNWRAWATGEFALESGRRVGAIGALRTGKQLDEVPLRASDFTTTESGRYEVVWRGEAAKGRGFGQGDMVQVCTRRMAIVYRYLRRFHPNPLGPEYPLIWDAENPSKGVSYDDLRTALTVSWPAVFEKEKPKGLCWHSFCYTTVTTIADELGMVAAADHTGRSVETIARKYKKRRLASQARTAKKLDEMRGHR